MKPGIALTYWARLIVGSVARAGIKNVVISPGSRSTPFSAAVLENRRLVPHLVVDERSAAFFALGLSRSTKTPTLLVCTSGTAAANYLPAIVEANQSRVPLIALTADRPVELQHCASAQTIDQTCLYGVQVRRFVDLGAPETDERILRSLSRAVVSAVHASRDPVAGPVHLEARARKPLEPISLYDGASPLCAEAQRLAAIVDSLVLEPVAIEKQLGHPADSVVDLVAADIVSRKRGFIFCGFDAAEPALDARALARLAAASGYPVLIDPSHPLRFALSAELAPQVISHHEALFRIPGFLEKNSPELLVSIGGPITSGPWERWLLGRSPRDLRVHVFSRDGWPEPAGIAASICTGDLNTTVKAVAQRVDSLLRAKKESEIVAGSKEGEAVESTIGPATSQESLPDWPEFWLSASRKAALAIGSALNSETGGWGECSAVRAAIDLLPEGGQLVLGNSLPIREADLVYPASQRGVTAYAFRGANGIDGILSAATGIAVGSDLPTMLLIGDVSFLHDIGGLYISASKDRFNAPFIVVILNNHGGRIFEQLPVAKAVNKDLLEYWTTPQDLDISHAAALYGLHFDRVCNLAEMRRAIGAALGRKIATVIEVPLAPQSAIDEASTLIGEVEKAVGLFELPKLLLTEKPEY